MTDEWTIRALNERYTDMLRAAEADRFIRVAAADRAARQPLRQPALARVGRWLIVTGRMLEARYGMAASFGPEVSTYANTSKYQF